MKTKFPRAAAVAVARDLCGALKPLCARLIVAGSLRRRKAEVGDVEIVYVPKFGEHVVQASDLFAEPKTEPVNRVDGWLDDALIGGRLQQRKNVRDAATWGPSNKLALHVASGIPVDLFSTTEEAWFNYLVCRTGGQVTNTRIASAALERGWKWRPTGAGFDRLPSFAPESFTVRSERDVFEFVGMPWQEPWERE